MKDTYGWAWIVGAVVVIMLILFWWRVAHAPSSMEQSAGYGQSTSTGALQSPNSPTAVVPVITPPLSSGSGASKSGADSTVISVLATIPNASRFAGLLRTSGVSATLTGKGPYTLFVPTNTSFSLLPPGALNLTASQTRRLVEYHIVSGKAVDVNALVAGTVPALSKDLLNFSVFPSDRSARVNSAVALKEYKAGNGVVYVISEVLLPPINAGY